MRAHAWPILPRHRCCRFYSQEAKRLGEAFEKPEFCGLFKDYMDEITDPNYRKVGPWCPAPACFAPYSRTVLTGIRAILEASRERGGAR